MPDQKSNITDSHYGGTMRLGAYSAKVRKNTITHKSYKSVSITERHRHRYEVNPLYIKKLEKGGLIFAATSPDGQLMEVIELPESVHPFFLGTQFHPEFKSRPLEPHPLFAQFIKVAAK